MKENEFSALPADLRNWIEERLGTGLYASPEEVLERAMEALEFIEFSEKLQDGLDQADRGEGREYDREGLEELKARIHQEGLKRLQSRAESA